MSVSTPTPHMAVLLLSLTTVDEADDKVKATHALFCPLNVALKTVVIVNHFFAVPVNMA